MGSYFFRTCVAISSTAYPDLEGMQLQLVYTNKVSVGATRKDLPGFTLLGCTFLDSRHHSSLV